jgi:hypothetical protein
MAKTRKVSKGLFGRVASPLFHLVDASRNVGKSAFKRSGNVFGAVTGFGRNTVGAVASHANMTVRNVLSRKNRKNKSRKNKKNRTNKKNRKNKSRK